MTQTTLSPEQYMYQATFAKAPLGIAIIDETGVILWINDLARQFLGRTIQEGHILLPSKDWPLFRQLLAAEKAFFYLIEEQGFIVTPQPLPTKEKRTLLWMLPSASMDFDLTTMQQDLSQQRKLANLGKMMLEMAHELNNPLASISMSSQLIALSLEKLKKHSLSDNPETAAKLLDVIQRIEVELTKLTESTSKASGLRQELLAYSKPNRLNLKPYRANKLLQTVLSNFEHQTLFRHIKIHKQFLEKSPTLMADPAKMEQILYNLFKNAHEATDGKGEVWVRETIRNGQVCIEVEDSGPGIPAELLDRIFSPFLTTKTRTGTGLGLSISQQIIQQHGGTFSVYNKPQSGACFVITLPVFMGEAG